MTAFVFFVRIYNGTRVLLCLLTRLTVHHTDNPRWPLFCFNVAFTFQLSSQDTRDRLVPDGTENHHHWQLEGVGLLYFLKILTVQQRNDLSWPQRNVDSEIRVAVIIPIVNCRPCCHITIVITITIIIIGNGLSGSSLFTHKIDQRPQSSSYRRRYNHRHQQIWALACHHIPPSEFPSLQVGQIMYMSPPPDILRGFHPFSSCRH